MSCEPPTSAFLSFTARNAFGQTSLHVACNVARQKSPNALDRRAYSVILLLRDAERGRRMTHLVPGLGVKMVKLKPSLSYISQVAWRYPQ